MKNSYLILFILLLLSPLAYAQSGIIRGTVIDDATGESIMGATVVIAGTTTGSATDLDGKFEIKAAAGTYNLQVSYITYKTITIEGVVVTADQVALFDNIRLKEDVETLAEVVISAEIMKVTEEALLTVKQKSINMMDGISSSSFRKIGDSNVASAVKRVPGVSIEGGKYVYVRGLGDRYTKSTLNGMDIPGLDPDRNTVQMDIFPTNVVDNIVVMKSFTADLPADFTGGVVDIATIDFPDQREMKFSLSTGFNPSMHFNSNYLTYEGGKTDFLGIDDGTRAIPTGNSRPLFVEEAENDPTKATAYNEAMKSFNPVLAAQQKPSFMDFGLGFSLGNQVAGNKLTLGYNLAFTYKNTTEFYEDATYARYGKSADASVTALEQRELQTGSYGTNNVLSGTLAGLALKSQRSKYRLNLLHLQNGQSKAGIFDYNRTDQGTNFDAYQHNLEYSERAITNALLHGKHQDFFGGFDIDWKLAGTRSKIDDPDIRSTRYRTDNDSPVINTESGIPQRIWRYLTEVNLAAKVDVSKSYVANGYSGKLKFGLGYINKDRSYEIRNFQILPGNNIDLTGNPDELFLEENLWSASNPTGTRYLPSFLPKNPNKYDGQVNNFSAYISNELALNDKLKAILGLRAEKFTQFYSGVKGQESVALDKERILNDLDFFPSVNVIYALKESQNLRLSFSQTIARPSFKEASYATIIDPITGRTFIGGLFEDRDAAGNVIWAGDLKATNINNFDIRWEAFQAAGQTVALSAFYKSFTNPIEIVQYATAANNFQPRNVGNGNVLGIELELRKNLEFLSPSLKPFAFQSNVTVTSSSIEMSETEYRSRIDNAREGENIDNKRNMAGQAPDIINAGFLYNGNKNGLEASVFYNVQGKTLQFVGIADRPDIYSVPFHSLNLSLSKTFGIDDRMRLSMNVSNLLNDNKEQVFNSFGSDNPYFSRLSPGTRFGFSFSYSL